MRNDIVLHSLQNRIKQGRPELLDRLIKEFSCAKDTDVEHFLKNNAIYYERKGLSRTYLYVTDDVDAPAIAAYFSVAITATNFQGISKSRKAKVLGFKPGRDTKDHFGGILVGQLARADGFGVLDINGHEMMKDTEAVIEKGRYYIGGKLVYIDCKGPLVGFYRENGYSPVMEAPYPDGYYKMFKVLPELAA
jgi:hypothetical protein